MPEPSTPADLAHVAWLSSVLPKGYAISRARQRWYLRRFDSFTTRDGPRLGWRDVDSDPRLEVLLQRLEAKDG